MIALDWEPPGDHRFVVEVPPLTGPYDTGAWGAPAGISSAFPFPFAARCSGAPPCFLPFWDTPPWCGCLPLLYGKASWEVFGGSGCLPFGYCAQAA